MDKPIHKVLEDYDLLNVSVIQNSNTINMTSAMLWKMNLCAVSNEIPCTFFVAMNYRVNVYTLDTIRSPFKAPRLTLASPNARQTGGGSESPFVINAIKIGRMLDKEILVTASENGEVCIWRTENLNEPPVIINNEVSTWGIAIHADQGLIAVSANSWKISIYNIVELTKDNPIYGKRSRRDPDNLMKSESKIELIGHQNNIPNIDFSESGRYIASSSIDQTCRVWDITTKEIVTQRKSVHSDAPEHDSWCWSVKFIKPGYFKYAVCIDKAISKAYLQRVYQGRSTSLINLGLSHSAASPVFPMNVSNVEDLMGEEEQVDFSVYENEDANDNIWDNALQEEEDFMEEMYERQRQQDNYIYSHGQIQDNDASQPTSPVQRAHGEPDDNMMHAVLSSSGLQDTIQDEIEGEYEFNLGLRDDMERERIGEEDEIIASEAQSRNEVHSRGTVQSQLTYENDVESPEDQDSESGYPDSGFNVWRTRESFPTQADWALSIVDDHTAANLDGWGDEIVTVMRNSSIDDEHDMRESSPFAVINHMIRESNSPDTLHESIPTFVSSNNGSSNWSDVTEDEDFATAEEELPIPAKRPSYCIPNAIKRSTSSINQLDEEKRKCNKKLNPSLGEYLMISTGKDVVMMSTTAPKMSRIRAEHNMINKVDVRSDQMLSILDRINMVEWLPEFELFVAASQKGTVALIRILQVEFEDGEQACIFNNECYLPTNVLQATPLYGMTVKKVVSERFTPISYQIFLFYYSGNVLGYNISRKDSDFLVESLIL